MGVYFAVRSGLFGSKTVKAVDGVSLKIKAGETVALVGESGSGKTSLGKATLKLAPIVKGRGACLIILLLDCFGAVPLAMTEE